MKKIVTIALLLSAFMAKSQEPTHIHYLPDPDGAEVPHSVDITKMTVNVSFEPQLGKVSGTVNHEFTTLQNNIDTLFFNAPDITILNAQLDGGDIKFYSNAEGVVVRFPKTMLWDEKHTLMIYYTALPKRGIYFIGWNEPENTATPDINYIRKQIWTQGQGTDNRYWIPMYDNLNDKFITETIVNIPAGFKALSNGRKLSQSPNADGSEKWHYTMDKPHAGYLLMLAIGKYDIKESLTKRGTPVRFWYYPEFKDRVEPTSIYTEKMIELLEDATGTAYPWGSYSQVMVQNFLYGAMENTSATVFGDFFTVDKRAFKDRNYMGVNCHELTHQWFGDLITARGGSDHWLQESFATFFPKLFFESLEGEDSYQWNLRGEYRSALAQTEKDNYPVRHTKAGTSRHYPKGSAVLSMLYYQMGKENFTRFVQYYLATNGYKNVETADFQKAIKDKLGMNYDWFFDQWIYRGGEPHFKVTSLSDKQTTSFNIQQTHQVDGHTNYFKMPITFAIYYKDGSITRDTQWVNDVETQTITIANNGKEIAFTLFDEQDRMMKKIEFKKSNAELMEQAAKARYMIDRYDAVVAMKELAVKDKLVFLQSRFALEKHHAIRAEIASQLANQKSLNKWYTLIVMDSKPEVKNAFIGADSSVKDQQTIFELLLKDSSYSVVENAFDKLMKSKDITEASKKAYLTKLQNTVGQNNTIKIKWLEYAIKNNFSDQAALYKQLSTYAGPNYEFRTRTNTANALKRLNYCNSQISQNLLEAALSYNSRLAGPCIDALKQLMKTTDNKTLIVNEINKLNTTLSLKDQDRLTALGLNTF